MRNWLWSAVTCAAVSAACFHVAFAQPTSLYHETYGTWTVECLRDNFNGRVGCRDLAVTTAQGPIGPTKLVFMLFSVKFPTWSIQISNNVMNWNVVSIFAKTDNGIIPIKCEKVTGDNCVITIDDRNSIYNDLQSSSELTIRVIDVYKVPHDFTFELGDFVASERALKLAMKQYVP